MSRSYREPYYGNSGGAKEWKRKANRTIRRDKEMDLSDGSHYKRQNDPWNSPMENKGGYWDVPQMKRK